MAGDVAHGATLGARLRRSCEEEKNICNLQIGFLHFSFMRRAGRFQFSADPRDNPRTLDELLRIHADDLHRCDIARLNLVCALGLPGTENLDIDHCIRTIDKWTNRVEFETRRHLYRAKDPRFADRYGGSQAKLSAEMLSQVLQEDCDVKYNPKRILDPDFRNPKDLFIHGIIGDSNGGTCTSMPVLYAAVARRLRYPVRLVHANAHLFCRWDDNGTRFNIECTSQGLIFHPDDYYRTWPLPISDAQVQRREYLTSLTPAQKLAGFFACRAWCLEDHGRVPEAVKEYEVACRLHPEYRGYRAFLNALLRKQNPIPVSIRVPMMRAPNAFGLPPRPHPSNNIPTPSGDPVPMTRPPIAPNVHFVPHPMSKHRL